MKQKMVEMWPVCKHHDVIMLLSVHDELDFSAEDPDRVKPVIKECLETFDGKACPIECRVPIRSSVKFDSNWWEASK